MSRYNIRYILSELYINGSGLEIGALHLPLAVKENVQVKYVDRFSVDELRKHYPELNGLNLVECNIVDDGEKLYTVGNETQDFVIANHFLEHCENPIQTVRNLMRVLKKDGILYMAIPDKRFTFDKEREITKIEHIIDEYENGTEGNRIDHFRDWVIHVDKITGIPEIEEKLNHLLKIDYSIHFHVWTQSEIMEFFITLKNKFAFKFDIEALMKNGEEFIAILRKTESVIEKNPSDELYESGMRYYTENNFSEAEKYFSKLCEFIDYKPDYLFHLGVSQFMQEKYDAAVDAFADCLELDPTRKETYSYIGKCLEKTGDPETAKSYFDKAKEL
jgi:predicted SAM-dependent methyltransferase